MEGDKIIIEASERILSKMLLVNFENIDISESGKTSITKYIRDYSYYMSLYSQLLLKAFKKLSKPISESSFIDYGGGCGILSFLAKEIGFKIVVYNDINYQAVDDIKIISQSLNSPIDYYIHGDVEEFIRQINSFRIKPDLICSFDVLEHIYDLEFWIKTISKIENEFSILFMTGANSNNPFIARRLKKLHIKCEYKGDDKNIRLNDIYLNTSYLEERRKIISNEFTGLKNSELDMLSLNTRGLRKNDIIKIVNDYINTGEFSYKIIHPTNTCDPYTGSWTERLIDLEQLKIFIKNNNLSVDISNSFYAYSGNKILNIPKYLFNLLISISGQRNLLFSPTYILEIQKP